MPATTRIGTPDVLPLAHSRLLAAAWAVLISGFLVSAYANSGPIQWSDQGVYIAHILRGDRIGYSALSHPLFSIAARGIAAVWGATGLAYSSLLWEMTSALLVFAICRRLRASLPASVIGAALFAWCHSVMWVGTKFEVYLLHCTVLLGGYWVLLTGLDRASRLLIVLGAALMSVSVLAHQLTLVIAPLLVLADRRTWTRRVLPCVILGAALGLLPLVAIYLFGARPEGVAAWSFFAQFFLGRPSIEGNRAADLLHLEPSRATFVALGMLGLSYVSPMGLLLVDSFRQSQPARVPLLVAGLGGAVFAATYNVIDRFQFQIPAMACFCIAGGLAFDALPRKRQEWLVMAIPVFSLVLGALTMLAASLHNFELRREKTPLRADLRYFGVPFLRDRSAEIFVREYLAVVPPNAPIACDYGVCAALSSASANGEPGLAEDRLLKFPSGFDEEDVRRVCAARSLTKVYIPRIQFERNRSTRVPHWVTGGPATRVQHETLGYSYTCP